MDTFWAAVIVIVLVLSGYVLYRHGYFVINTKTALLYLGVPRLGKNRNRLKATFIACNGSVQRVIHLPASKTYRFVFSANTTKGSVWAEVYGKDGDFAARLSSEQPCVTLHTGKCSGYRIITRFDKADGDYALIWEEI